MATTVFVNGSTLTDAGWFNDVDAITYDGTTAQMLVGGGAGTIAVWTAATGSGSPVRGTSPSFTTSVISASTTLAVFNTVATTVNAFGAATTLNIGNAGGTNTILGATTFSSLTSIGRVGIGATNSAASLYLASTGAIPSGTTTHIIYIDIPHATDSTTEANGITVRGQLANGSGITYASRKAVDIQDVIKNGGSDTLTVQAGVGIEDLTSGASNYGILNEVSSGLNKWGYFGSGNAQNGFVGNVRIGSTVAPTVALDVTGAGIFSSTLASGALTVTGAATATGAIRAGGATSYGTLGQNIQSNGTGYAGGFSSVVWAGADASISPNLYFQKSRGASAGTHTIVSSGDRLALIVAEGSDGSGFVDAGSITARVFGTPASGDVKARWEIRSGSVVSGIFGGTGLTIGSAAVARGTTDPTNAINIFNGTAPVGTLTNGVTLYSASGELRVMDAAGNSTLLSPHDDDGLWVYDSVSPQTGKHLRIDMEKLVKAVNDHFGWDFIHEQEIA